jgi:hypothetical protein
MPQFNTRNPRPVTPNPQLVTLALQLVTPDSIGGPCLLSSPTMDTRMRGYDKHLSPPTPTLVTPEPSTCHPRLDRGSMPAAFAHHGYPHARV